MERDIKILKLIRFYLIIVMFICLTNIIPQLLFKTKEVTVKVDKEIYVGKPSVVVLEECVAPVDLGEYTLTAYCNCKICCGEWAGMGITASGNPVQSNHTIAADTKILPFGSKVRIGDNIYTVEDVGGKIKGKHIDIYFDTHKEAEAFGLQKQNVYLIEED